MEVPPVPNEQDPQESLANIPPTPARDDAIGTPGTNFAKLFLLMSAAGAGIFALIGSTQTACMGATRSAKLKWQERQLEIEQAARDANYEVDDKQ